MSDLYDSVGGAHLFGGNGYSFVPDRFNNSNSAIYFNNGYLQIPPGVYFSGDFSVTAWIKIKQTIAIESAYLNLFSFGNLCFSDYFAYPDIFIKPNYQFEISFITYKYSSSKSIYSSNKLELDTWYHVAFILNGTTGFIYVNGTQISNGSLSSPLDIVRNCNYIGRSSYNSFQNAYAIDEFKIYKGALTSNQILYEYKSSYSATLLNYWKMSDLTDSAGEAHLFGGSNYEFAPDRFNILNSAIYFNKGFLQIPSGVYFNGDFSITAWINNKDNTYFSKIVDFANEIYINLQSSLNGGLYQSIIFKSEVYSSNNLELNTWYHVAFISNNKTGFLYLNGVLIASGLLLPALNVLREYNYIGTGNAIYDEIQIFQGALTENQVVDNINSLVISLECESLYNCTSLSYYKKISRNGQLRILGNCVFGCSNQTVTYPYKIFKGDSFWNSNSNWTDLPLTTEYFTDWSTRNLIIKRELFQSQSSIFWKVELTVVLDGVTKYGSNEIILYQENSTEVIVKINELPQNGSCLVSPLSGFELKTYFTITCLNWNDPDGYISAYEFYYTWKGNSSLVLLDNNTLGTSTFQLPIGPFADSFKISFFIRILDNLGGITEYLNSTQVIVKKNELPQNGSCLVNLADGMVLEANFQVSCLNWTDSDGYISAYEFYYAWKGNSSLVLFGNNTFGISAFQLPISSIEDSININLFVKIIDNFDGITQYLISSSEVAQQKDRFVSRIVDILLNSDTSVSAVNNLKNENISSITSFIDSFVLVLDSQISFLNATKINKQVKGVLIEICSNIRLKEVSDILLLSNSFSNLANKTNEISSNSVVLVLNKISEMVQYLWNVYTLQSLSFINQASGALMNSITNYLNAIDLKSNEIQLSAAMISNMFQIQNDLVSKMGIMISSKLDLDQELLFKTESIELIHRKSKATTFQGNIKISEGEIVSPSICNILRITNDSCSNLILISQTLLMQKALKSLTDNATVSGSKAVSLSFFNENKTVQSISNSSSLFFITIPRDKSSIYPSFIRNNNSNITDSRSLLKLDGFILPNESVAIQYQIKPDNLSLGYFVALKFGGYPSLKRTLKSFDLSNIFCPKDLKTEDSISFFVLFANNISYSLKLNKFFGIGTKELNSNEFNYFCERNKTDLSHLNNETKTNFTSEISTRVILSSCYYLDETTGFYSSYGMQLLETTNRTHTHCSSNHLTQFAGGWITVPNAINFDYVFAKASFLQNITIYMTVITITTIYFILLIWTFQKDRKDKLRTIIRPIEDNEKNDDYFYEIIFYTGTRFNAGTDSNLRLQLFGDLNASRVIQIQSNKGDIKSFKTSGIDSFILSSHEPLRSLNYLRICHDNSGEREMASWFLKFIVFHDLQTRDKSYFICNKWLALDKEDGSIDRILFISLSKQKSEFKYLFEKETKDKFKDDHLWFSLFTRPAHSSFTRTDRLTCCFVLLYMTMLMNIIYYDIQSDDSSDNGTTFDIQQISIGVITNIILIPPSLLLVYLFRNSRNRVTRIDKLKSEIKKIKGNFFDQKKFFNKNEDIKGKNKFSFPWWFKRLAYFLSLLLAVVSIFFIIMKGISLGNEQSTKWLQSILVSVVSSLFLIQPIQVLMITFFLVFLFRNSNDSNDSNDSEFDPADNGEPIYFNEKLEIYDNILERNADNVEIFNSFHEDTYLNEIRENNSKDKDLKNAFKEIFLYLVFAGMTLTLAYQMIDSNTFNYQNNLRNLFAAGDKSTKFFEVTRISDIYEWSVNVLAPNLSQSQVNLISDNSSILLGNAIIKQKRIIQELCPTYQKNIHFDQFCYYDYSFLNEDNMNYSQFWSTNLSFITNDVKLDESFKYIKSNVLKDNIYFGKYSTYLGGGYVYNLTGNLRSIQNDLSSLQEMNWIDRRTRAILIEFSLFNPNVNLLSFCQMVFELAPCGTIIPSFKFTTFNLWSQSKEGAVNIIFTVYLIVISFLMIKEVKSIKQKGFKYFIQFWSLINWSLFGCSFGALPMYLFKIYSLNEFKMNKSINLSTLSQLNETLGILLAFCSFFATLKLISLLKLNQNLGLTKTIKNSRNDLIPFLIVLIIIWLAFVQLMHLFYIEKTFGYSTFIKSMETGFLILLGKFELKTLVQSNYTIGALLFTSYNFIVLILMINLMLAILSDHFSKTNKEFKLKETITVFDQLLSKFKFQAKSNQRNIETYKQINEIFELRTKELVNNLKNQIETQSKFASELNCVLKLTKH